MFRNNISSTHQTGITQNKNSLDRYFIIAPALHSIVEEFHQLFTSNKIDAPVHHELIRAKSSRMLTNMRKMIDLLRECGVGCETNDTPLHNIFTNEIVPENIAKHIVDRDVLGSKLCNDFINERLIEGKKSVWDGMSKSSILTFSSNFVVVDPKTAKVKRLKQDRDLFHRFIIASRSRPDLDMKEWIPKFEFGDVCRPLFACDGNMLLASDKSKIVTKLESQAKDVPATECDGCYDVIILDGMALLHKVRKGPDMKNCEDLSQAYIQMLVHHASTFDEVHLVMDRYLERSLKNLTRTKRATTKRQFVIGPKTNLQGVSMKDLLSNSKTKNDLVKFLCERALEYSRKSSSLKNFCVTFGTDTFGNFEFDERLRSHSQEEADTLLILHASTLHNECNVVVDSPDTDVLLLLIHYMPYLPRYTVFRTGLTFTISITITVKLK